MEKYFCVQKAMKEKMTSILAQQKKPRKNEKMFTSFVKKHRVN